MKTFLLGSENWDLGVDASGNIATVDHALPTPLGLAQDAASAIRLFAGELYYDTREGIPYFQKILGQRPPLALLKAYLTKAAETVPGVVSATCYISSFTDRGISGQVQVFDSNGNSATAAF